MNKFESWRREVNIILQNTIGCSLKDLSTHIEEDIKHLYEDGIDPLDGAQYAVKEIDPSLDIEQILVKDLAFKSKLMKNTKKKKKQSKSK